MIVSPLPLVRSHQKAEKGVKGATHAVLRQTRKVRTLEEWSRRTGSRTSIGRENPLNEVVRPLAEVVVAIQSMEERVEGVRRRSSSETLRRFTFVPAKQNVGAGHLFSPLRSKNALA